MKEWERYLYKIIERERERKKEKRKKKKGLEAWDRGRERKWVGLSESDGLVVLLP